MPRKAENSRKVGSCALPFLCNSQSRKVIFAAFSLQSPCQNMPLGVTCRDEDGDDMEGLAPETGE